MVRFIAPYFLNNIHFFLLTNFFLKASDSQLFMKSCEGRGPERKNWIPASAGMTNIVSVTGTK